MGHDGAAGRPDGGRHVHEKPTLNTCQPDADPLRAADRPPAHAATTLLALALTALGGCASPPADQLRDPEAVLALARGRLDRGDVRTLQTSGRLYVARRSGTRSLRVDLTLARPGRLAMTAYEHGEDAPVAGLASDGRRFMAWDRASGRCYSGAPCRENLARFLALAVDGAALVDLLLGAPPSLVEGIAAVTWDDRTGSYRVEVTQGRQRQRTWVAHGSGLSARTELSSGSKVVTQILSAGLREIDGRTLPTSLRLQGRSGRLTVHLSYREAFLNGEDVDPDAFTPRCPSWATPEPLTCAGAR